MNNILIEKYLEIIDGSSSFNIKNNNILYVKHLDQHDVLKLNLQSDLFLKNACQNGIKTEQEQVDFIINKGWWNIQNELEIKTSLELIDRLNKTKKSLKYPSEKKRLEEQIIDCKKKIFEIKQKRSSLISITAENIVEQNVKSWFIVNYFFKNKECSIKYISEEDFDYLYDNELNIYESIYDKFLSRISNKDIQMIAASIFFQNIFFVGGGSCFDFFGKSVVKLTRNQNDLFLYGKMFRSFLDNSTKKIPNEVLEDPEKFLLYIESANQNIEIDNSINNKKSNIRGRQKIGNSSSFLFGNTNDAKQMGIRTGEKELFAKAEAKGGQTSLIDEII